LSSELIRIVVAVGRDEEMTDRTQEEDKEEIEVTDLV